MKLLMTAFLVVLLLPSTVLVTALYHNKTLVFFAGPHKSASTRVEKFFYDYCNGHDRTKHGEYGKKFTFPLRFWRWPRIETDLARNWEPDEPYKIFQHLVKPHTAELDRDILNGITTAWNKSNDGVILGTEWFDQVGDHAQYDAVGAMKKVIDHLGADNVTIVLNYRSPRIEQWASVWKHDDDQSTYDEFLCDKKHHEHRVQLIGTQMNPLNAAKVFLEEKLGKVVLMDMEGISKVEFTEHEDLEYDVAHAIACDVMNGRCNEEGWVRNHKKQKVTVNEGTREFEGLTEEEMILAEKVLTSRDCLYEDVLTQDPNFEILYKSSIWEDCDPDYQKVYEKMEDPAIVFKSLLSQTDCSAFDSEMDVIKIEDILEPGSDYYSTADIVTVMGKGGGRGGGGDFLEAIMFPIILIGAFGYQVFVMLGGRLGERNSGGLKERHAAVMEAEMSAVMSDEEFGDLELDEEDIPQLS